jgi:hypothetical protein
MKTCTVTLVSSRDYIEPNVEVYAYKKGSRWGIYMHHDGQILTPIEDGGLFFAPGEDCPHELGTAPYKTLKALKEHYPNAKRRP